MMESNLAQIERAEELLRQAMLTSDVESLDALISPDLVFTTHFGSVISKHDDLEIHRRGVLKFHTIELTEQKILAMSNVMFVSVRARVTGIFGNSHFQDPAPREERHGINQRRNHGALRAHAGAGEGGE